MKKIISWLITLLPVSIYNIVNQEAFKEISSKSLSITFLIALGAVGLGVLAKFEKTTVQWFIIIGAVLTMLGSISEQLGHSLLLLGGGLLIGGIVNGKKEKLED